MVEVKIRTADQAYGVFLAEVPLDEVGDVIPQLKVWGIQDRDAADLEGQFVVDEDQREAYFEVILGD